MCYEVVNYEFRWKFMSFHKPKREKNTRNFVFGIKKERRDGKRSETYDYAYA